MALLRSDILNKEFVEGVLQQIEGTKRVTLLTLTVGADDTTRTTLLEERLRVQATAKVRVAEKSYCWIAKLFKAEADAANHARFQGILETEANFYHRLVPELVQMGAPLPVLPRRLHSDYRTPGREVLLIEDLQMSRGFEAALTSACMVKDGLDLDHVIPAVEWLARLHGLGYVLLRRHPGGPQRWLAENPWIRNTADEERSAEARHAKRGSKSGRSSLMSVAAETLKREAAGQAEIEALLDRQDWLDCLKKEVLSRAFSDGDAGRVPALFTICHGEPWLGNALFKYKAFNGGKVRYPVSASLGDLHACSYGKPGADLAHFLITSTTRSFRRNYLETILQAYLCELEDVVQSQGIDDQFYSRELLKKDYKEGLLRGVAFCLFAMPALLAGPPMSHPTTTTNGRTGSEEGEVDTGEQLGPVARSRILGAIRDLVEM